VPEWASQEELEPDVRRDLRGLSKEGAEFVGGHLVAAGTLADDDPELAWLHARAARSKGGRIAVVRETVGLVGYRAGHWAEAISELRAARRMGGGPGHLAVLADCERALGHPDKAIEISRSAEAEALDQAAAVELTIVTAGARADLGQLDAALVTLEAAGATDAAVEPWTARLQYAYADLLAKAERRREALTWFMRAYDADTEDETDAAERIAELAAEQDTSATGPVEVASGVDTPEVDTALDDDTEPDADTEPDVETEPDEPEPDDDTASDDLTVPKVEAEPMPTGPDSSPDNAGEAELDVPAADAAPEPGVVSAQLFSHADAPERREPEEG
jgi:tetratricopeptide (TPR) repeat protein